MKEVDGIESTVKGSSPISPWEPSWANITHALRCYKLLLFSFLFFCYCCLSFFFCLYPHQSKGKSTVIFPTGLFLSLSLSHTFTAVCLPLLGNSPSHTHTHTNVLRLDYYMYGTAQQQQQKKKRGEITSEGRPGPLLSPTIRPKL